MKEEEEEKKKKKKTPRCDALIAVLQCSICQQLQQVWQRWSVQPGQMECRFYDLVYGLKNLWMGCIKQIVIALLFGEM